MSAAPAAPAADYPVPAAIAAHPAWFRLEGQRSYYSTRAARYQDTYKHIKMGLIGLSASIPLLAFLPPQNAGPWIVRRRQHRHRRARSDAAARPVRPAVGQVPRHGREPEA